MDQALTGIPQLGMGFFNITVEPGIFNGHTGLIGKQLQYLELLISNRLMLERVVNDNDADQIIAGCQRDCGKGVDSKTGDKITFLTFQTLCILNPVKATFIDNMGHDLAALSKIDSGSPDRRTEIRLALAGHGIFIKVPVATQWIGRIRAYQL